MPQYNDLPEGATVSTPQYSDIPEGAQVQSVPQQQPIQQPKNSPSPEDKDRQQAMLQQSQAELVPEIAKGFGKGILSTTHYIGDKVRQAVTGDTKLSPVTYAAEKIREAITPEEQNKDFEQKRDQLVDKVLPKQGLKAEESMSHPEGAGQMIGYGGETLVEFLLGDEALKGLSLADKALTIAKASKFLEKSPRLMEALKLGAAAGKAISKLTPEESAVVQKYPKIAKMIGIGEEALRQGTIQTGSTEVHTGGDTKQALKEGAVMTGVSAGLGTVGEAVKSVLKNASKGGETVNELTDIANKTPDKDAIVSKTSDAVNASKEAMHTEFEKAVNDMKDGLSNVNMEIKGSPVSNKAKELLISDADKFTANNELVNATKSALGDRLDAPVRSVLEMAAKGEKAVEKVNQGSSLVDASGNLINPTSKTIEMQPFKPWTVDDLVSFRQDVRKLAESYPKGDINARTLKQLLPSVDDTIEAMAGASDKKELLSNYQKVRSMYRTKSDLLRDNPILNSLSEGKMDDAAKKFISGQTTRSNALAVRDFIGPEGMKEFSNNIFGSMLKDSIPNEGGRVNAARLVDKWNKIPKETKELLFDGINQNSVISELMKDAKSAAKIQHLTRAGVLAGVGSTAGLTFGHAGIGTLLALTAGERGFGGMPVARDLLDYVANHPKIWNLYRVASKVANSKTANVANTAAKVGLTNVVSGTGDEGKQDTKRKAYAGASNVLSGK